MFQSVKLRVESTAVLLSAAAAQPGRDGAVPCHTGFCPCVRGKTGVLCGQRETRGSAEAPSGRAHRAGSWVQGRGWLCDGQSDVVASGGEDRYGC